MSMLAHFKAVSKMCISVCLRICAYVLAWMCLFGSRRLHLCALYIHTYLRVHVSVCTLAQECACACVRVCMCASEWVIVSRSSLTSEVITTALRFTPIRQNKRQAKNKTDKWKTREKKVITGGKIKSDFQQSENNTKKNRFKWQEWRKNNCWEESNYWNKDRKWSLE